jgi:hypothetical protein
MRNRSVTLLAAALLGLGCLEKPGPSPGEIIGTWVTTSMVFTGKAGQGTLDLSQQGHQGTLVISADGAFTWHVVPTFVGNPCDLEGTWELETDLFRMWVGGGHLAWDISVSGGTLHLDTGDGSYDWDGDLAVEGTSISLTLQHP